MKESGTYIMLHDRIKIQGQTIADVARETGISRNTIKKYLHEGEHEHKSKGRKRPSLLDAYKAEIDSFLKMGIYNATTIYDRIREIGYGGGITIVKDYIHPLRPPALKSGGAVRRYETKPGKQAQMDVVVNKKSAKKAEKIEQLENATKK